MTVDSYAEKVDWLFNQFPVFQKVGKSAYKPTLENTLALIQFFDIPIEKMNFVHVAGTNGKGTTCSIVASALSEAKRKTGLFTSPHIKDFRERIRVDGAMISAEEVIDYITQIQTAEFDFSPSFFEITWAMALAHFYKNDCDFVVVETGLGGRLDATNVISPVLSVITNIGLDHVSILGDSRKEIAKEKAGIIKKDTPVLIGESDDEINSVFEEKAKQENAPLHFLKTVNVDNTFELNKKLGYKAIDLLLEEEEFVEKIKTAAIFNLKKNTGFYGRYEVYSKRPLIIIDAAHNPMGIERLVKDIQLKYSDKNIHALYGASNDKELSEIIALLPEEWIYYITEFNSERSTKLDDFKSVLKNYPLNIKYFSDAKVAFKEAQNVDFKNDILLVFGSFFLLEEII